MARVRYKSFRTKVEKETRAHLKKKMGKLALQIKRDVVALTPVDQGFLKKSYTTQIKSKHYGIVGLVGVDTNKKFIRSTGEVLKASGAFSISEQARPYMYVKRVETGEWGADRMGRMGRTIPGAHMFFNALRKNRARATAVLAS